MEVGLFHGIVRKAFHRPTRGRLWYGKICLGGNRKQALCPISVSPAMEEVQPCLLRGQNKGQCPDSVPLSQYCLSPHPVSLALFLAVLLYSGSCLEPMFGVHTAAGCTATWLPGC